MIRTTLAKAYIKRPFRPLYGWTQMTPKSEFLDAAWDRSVDVFPGFAATKTGAETVSVPGAATDNVMGLFANYIAPTYGIDEVADSGISATAVWVLGPDAEAEVLSESFSANGGAFAVDVATPFLDVQLFAITAGAHRGKLAPAGSSTAVITTAPVCRLLKVVSTTKLVVGGLKGA